MMVKKHVTFQIERTHKKNHVAKGLGFEAYTSQVLGFCCIVVTHHY